MSSAKSLLIRQARVILPNGEFIIGDVLTQGGKIVEVASEISYATPTQEI
ncbi:MAG: dihydroorotase, partial [Sphaerospermopsis kisseleviana]